MQELFYVPLQDSQAAIPIRYCDVCHREVYTPDGLCLYCLVHGA